MAPGRPIHVVQSSNELNRIASENPRAIVGWGSQGVYACHSVTTLVDIGGQASAQSIAISGLPPAILSALGVSQVRACMPRRSPLGLTLAAKGSTLANPCLSACLSTFCAAASVVIRTLLLRDLPNAPA